MSRSFYAVPALYILVDATKALVTEGLNAIDQTRRIPATNPLIVLLTELIKLAVSLFIVQKHKIKIEWSQSYLFAVLTFLYYVNSSLYLTCFRYASAPSISLLLYAKIPVTVVMHHVFIRRQVRSYPWILLAILLAGALTTQISDTFSVTNNSVLVICAVLSMNSALASIYQEKLLKSLAMSFWSQQVITYALTASWSLVHLSTTESPTKLISLVYNIDPSVRLYMIIISLLAGLSGISTGLIIKYIDTIARLLAGIVVSVLVTIGIFVCFAKSPDSWLFFSIGSVIICVSVYLYGVDLKQSTVSRSLTEGRHTSVQKLLFIMVLTLPVSLIVLLSY